MSPKSKTKPREKRHGPARIVDDSLHRYWREEKRAQKRRRG